MKLEEGFYHLKAPGESEPVMVHFYFSSDVGENGFGFNTHDGGGFLPLSDVADGTEIVKLEITEVL